MKDEPIFELSPEDFEDVGFPPSSISRALDQLLEDARSGKFKLAPVMPVVGMTGSGKTSIVREWLKYNKLKNWYFSGIRSISQIEVEYYRDLPSEPQVRIVSGEELNDLFSPEKKLVNVLFSSKEIDAVDEQTIIVIDDYDRASPEVRKELFDLILNLQVVDPRMDNENKIRVLKPLMIVVIIDSLNVDVLSDKEKNIFGVE